MPKRTMREQFLYAIRQRDDLLLLISNLYPAHRTKAKKADPALWRDILIIELPTGQISYHLPPAEVERFKHLPRGPNTWDGHDEKERALRIWTLWNNWE